jgi:aspartate aminotransferase
LALVQPGDEVLIPAPFWVSYPEIVKVAQGTPRILPTTYEQGFKLQPAQLKAALNSRVKAIFINSPSNPSGVMYSKAELRALGEVILSTPAAENTWVITDEIYDRVILGDIPFCSFLEAVPELASRTVTVNGLAKSAAMTGWRVGWSIAPDYLTQGLITLQGQSTSGINSVAQWAGVAALKLPESVFEGQAKTFRRRRDIVLEILGKTNKIEVLPPDGAFYAFVGVRKCFQPGEDSMGFAQRLLENAKVALVPGTPFGEPGFLRLSYATDEKTLKEGCERLVGFLK